MTVLAGQLAAFGLPAQEHMVLGLCFGDLFLLKEELDIVLVGKSACRSEGLEIFAAGDVAGTNRVAVRL